MGIVIRVLMSLLLAASLSSPKYECFLRLVCVCVCVCVRLLFIFLTFSVISFGNFIHA